MFKHVKRLRTAKNKCSYFIITNTVENLLRYYNDIIWIFEYLDDGLTKAGNKLFLDKSLRNSYAMREKRIKQAENDPITAAEDKPKLRKYFTKEQEKRDQVLKYILSI